MLSNSSIIAIGKIIDKSDAFGVVPVGGGTQYNFTDYTFEIADQLKGTQKSDVIIRVLGGTVDNFTVESEYAPDFVIGEQYLLFLSKVDVGGGYNTAGDYYTVFGSNQGVFTHDKDDDYFNSFYDKSYNCGSLKNTLSSTPSYANAFSSRAEFIQNQKRNLENGFISQAEYDATIASLDVYAEIVK